MSIVCAVMPKKFFWMQQLTNLFVRYRTDYSVCGSTFAALPAMPERAYSPLIAHARLALLEWFDAKRQPIVFALVRCASYDVER